MPGDQTNRKSRSFGTQTPSARSAHSAREKGVQVDSFPRHAYPDLKEKAAVTQARQQRNMFPRVMAGSFNFKIFQFGIFNDTCFKIAYGKKPNFYFKLNYIQEHHKHN